MTTHTIEISDSEINITPLLDFFDSEDSNTKDFFDRVVKGQSTALKHVIHSSMRRAIGEETHTYLIKLLFKVVGKMQATRETESLTASDVTGRIFQILFDSESGEWIDAMGGSENAITIHDVNGDAFILTIEPNTEGLTAHQASQRKE